MQNYQIKKSMNENLIDVLEASWMMMIENYELRMTFRLAKIDR